MEKILAYYASHSPITDPGEWISLYKGLPNDLPGLFVAIQGVLLHRNSCKYYGIQRTPEQVAANASSYTGQYLKEVIVH
jgi:hypothetical protein